jgi:hypothetical protein
MLGEINLPVLGIGCVFVIGCVVLGASSNGPLLESRPPQAEGRLVAADLDTISSHVPAVEQQRAADVCTEALARQHARTAQSVVGMSSMKAEEIPYYCRCIVRGAAGGLSRFQFLVMEASLRVVANRPSSPFQLAKRATGPEIDRLGREAMAFGMTHAEVQASIDDAEQVVNRVARNCISDVSPPSSPWQRKAVPTAQWKRR